MDNQSINNICDKNSKLDRKNITLLLVDDDPIILQLYELYTKHFINHEKDKVYKVNLYKILNPIEALDKINEILPNVILTDINMPQMNGLEFIRELRKRNYKGKIIASSSSVFSNYRCKAMEAGADLYLQKPINKEQFAELINHYFKNI